MKVGGLWLSDVQLVLGGSEYEEHGCLAKNARQYADSVYSLYI